MKRTILTAVGTALFLVAVGLFPQQTQVPSTLVANTTSIKGRGAVSILPQGNAQRAGSFEFNIGVSFDPQQDDFPAGVFDLTIRLRDMRTESNTVVYVTNLGIMQATSVGQFTPTGFIYAKCDVLDSGKKTLAKGYLWMMLVDNKKERDRGTPDIVQIILLDKSGSRIATACGPLEKGDVVVTTSMN